MRAFDKIPAYLLFAYLEQTVTARSIQAYHQNYKAISTVVNKIKLCGSLFFYWLADSCRSYDNSSRARALMTLLFLVSELCAAN